MARAMRRIYILMIKANSCFLFFVVEFSKTNRKHVLCVSIEMQKDSWKFGRTCTSCGNTEFLFTAFLVLPIFQYALNFLIITRCSRSKLPLVLLVKSFWHDIFAFIAESPAGHCGPRATCDHYPLGAQRGRGWMLALKGCFFRTLKRIYFSILKLSVYSFFA